MIYTAGAGEAEYGTLHLPARVRGSCKVVEQPTNQTQQEWLGAHWTSWHEGYAVPFEAQKAY